jgi:hypothetical protein
MLKEQSALVKTKPFLHGWFFSQACFGKNKSLYHGVFAMIVSFACIACAFPLFLDRGEMKSPMLTRFCLAGKGRIGGEKLAVLIH